MKKLLFCCVGAVAACCHGGLFDSALKTVNKAAEVVNAVDDARKPPAEAPQAPTPQSPIVEQQPQEAAPQSPVVAQQPQNTALVNAKDMPWDATGYQARVAKVNEAMPKVSPKLPFNGDLNDWYNAAYGLTTTERQYSFLPPAQRIARISEDDRVKIDKFIGWVDDGMHVFDSIKDAAEKQHEEQRIADEKAAKEAKEAREKEAKRQLDAQVAYEKQQKEENAALEVRGKIYRIQSDCETAIFNSKLSDTEKDKRKAALNSYFIGDEEANLQAGRKSAALTVDQANDYKAKLEKELADIAALASSTDETVLRKAIDDKILEFNLEREASKQLVSITKDPNVLISYYNGDKKDRIWDQDRETVVVRLAGFADKLTDTNVIVSLLKDMRIKDVEQRGKLMSRLPEETAFSYVTDALKRSSVDAWNKNELQPFGDAISMLKSAKGDVAINIVSCILAKFAEYENTCKNSWILSWGDSDIAAVKKIVDQFPKFDDATLEGLLCADEASWAYVTNDVPAAVAYNILSGGKSKSGELEIALAKMLPQEKIDMKVYTGVRFVSSKKALYDRMSPTVKESVDSSMKAAYKKISMTAKSEAKNTFELHDFYLGMPFDDVKIVLAHHFPEMSIREEIDGKGENADYAIYIDGQSTPFCFARTSDKKVRLFNFGKKILKKWYDFDTQTYMEWAVLYGKKTKSDMRLKLVEDKTRVVEPDGSDYYTVWFHQESYQYKNNTKGFQVIYFGEERDYTFEGGIGGDVIKSIAAKDFRYVRGDPGSLRVRVMQQQ